MAGSVASFPQYPAPLVKAKGSVEFAFRYLSGMLSDRAIFIVAALTTLSAVGSTLGTRQTGRIDVGSFTTFVDGHRAGREQFSLQAMTTAEGRTFELRVESAAGEHRAAVRLETDSAGTPLRYTVEERDSARVSLRLGGQRVRGRFATLSRGTRGEAAREYLLTPGAIVLEADGVHQYVMLVRQRTMNPGDSVRVPTLSPIENRQGAVWLTLESTGDTATVAGVRRSALRWRAVTMSGQARTIWADAEGRILRLRIPAERFEAIRDDIPR